MLVFSRKRDEAIVIGDGVEVRVLRIGRDGVRLGITAPTSVPVHRREIYDLIRAENQTAAQAAVSTPAAVIERLRRATAVPAADHTSRRDSSARPDATRAAAPDHPGADAPDAPLAPDAPAMRLRKCR